MRPLIDSPLSRKNKELSRKIVINYSDSDSDSEDIYCPTWLKYESADAKRYEPSTVTSYGGASSSTDIPRRGPSIGRSFSNKRGIDITLDKNPMESYRAHPSKKVNSPMHTRFFQNNTREEVKSLLIEFIETEIAYFKILSSIYRHCLQIFSERENRTDIQKKCQGSLLRDLSVMKELSYQFIVNLVQGVISSTGFKDTDRISQFKSQSEVENDRSEVLGYDISALVVNCDTSRFQLGSFLNTHFGCNKFTVVMASFSYKQDLLLAQLEGLYEKECYDTHDLFGKFPDISTLMDGRFRLEVLVLFPLKRLARYPVMIKQLIDHWQDYSHELNTSLIKVNQLLNRCSQGKASSWKDLEVFDENLKEEYKEDSRYDVIEEFDALPLRSANDFKLKYAGKEETRKDSHKSWPIIQPQTDYLPIVANFKRKYDKLLTVEQRLRDQVSILQKFMDSQLKYAIMWDGVLSEKEEQVDDRYIKSIYSSFVSKMRTHSGFTAETAKEMNSKVIAPLENVICLCDGIIDQIRIHRRYKSAQAEVYKLREGPTKLISKRKQEKAHICTRIEQEIHEKLPFLTHFISQIVNLVFLQFNRLYCQWLRQLIGERSLQEYSELASARSLASRASIEDGSSLSHSDSADLNPANSTSANATEPSNTANLSLSAHPPRNYDIVVAYHTAMSMTWQALEASDISNNRSYRALFHRGPQPEAG